MGFGFGDLFGAAIPLAGSLFGSRGGANPGGAAQQHLGRIPQYGYDAYNPFIKTGQNAESQLYPQLSSMAGQPVDFLNQIMSQYQQSPGYKYREDRNLRQAHGTAAAGGFVGSDNDIENRTGLVNDLMNQDMQEFLNNVLGIQGTGQQGLENRVGRGFDASSRLADYLGGASGAQAGAAAYGRDFSNRGEANVFNSLGGLFSPGGIFGKSK